MCPGHCRRPTCNVGRQVAAWLPAGAGRRKRHARGFVRETPAPALLQQLWHVQDLRQRGGRPRRASGAAPRKWVGSRCVARTRRGCVTAVQGPLPRLPGLETSAAHLPHSRLRLPRLEQHPQADRAPAGRRRAGRIMGVADGAAALGAAAGILDGRRGLGLLAVAAGDKVGGLQ